MELFRAKLRDLCHENCENKYFVPQQSLYEVLNRQNVKAVLEDQGIEKQQLDGLALNILQGKRAIFGILVYIRNVPSILRFVETDRFESHDQRLPYSLEDLRKIYSAPTAKEFYEEQWRFIAPIFSKNTLPRILEDRIILPIVEQIDSVDHGGFGDIHKIRLHHHHQQFFDSPAKWVRILIIPDSSRGQTDRKSALGKSSNREQLQRLIMSSSCAISQY